MSTSIIRMFETTQQAAEAVRILRSNGFEEEAITVFHPPASTLIGGPAMTEDTLFSALVAGTLLKSEAVRCADALRAGRSIVILRAPFGTAETAEAVLGSCGPVAIEGAAPRVTWSDAAPLSSALGFAPVIRNPAPLSNFLSLPLLSVRDKSVPRLIGVTRLNSRFSLSRALGLGEISQNRAPLGSITRQKTILPFPTTANCPAPLSSLLGWQTKPAARKGKSNPAPFSSVTGWPTLSRRQSGAKVPLPLLASPRFTLTGGFSLISRKATPLSSMLGLGTVSRKAAPLSSMLGLGTVSRRAAPLSSLFGLGTKVRCPAPCSALFGLPVLASHEL